MIPLSKLIKFENGVRMLGSRLVGGCAPYTGKRYTDFSRFYQPECAVASRHACPHGGTEIEQFYAVLRA